MTDPALLQTAAELSPSRISRYAVGGLPVGLGIVDAVALQFPGSYAQGHWRSRSQARAAVTGAD